MAPLPDARQFAPAALSVRGEEPLLIGLIGPPGGGKTVSALRLATGMRTVRSGPVVLIDTEGGRSKKYSPGPGEKPDPAALRFEFLRVEMTPPFRSHDFMAAIKAQLPLKPAAIIVDCLSDEHEGEGGFLEWHDEMIPKMGGNEWAAWAVPKAARKRLLSGLLQIKVPMLFTFRAREKTVTEPGKGKGGRDKITNIGWMPVAPLEIVHTLDLTCILPPKADGVPVWSSEKIGEDFIVKLPAFLKPLIREGQLSESTGEALARWAKGEQAQGAAQRPASATQSPEPDPDKAAALAKALETLQRLASKEERGTAMALHFGGATGWSGVKALDLEAIEAGTTSLSRELDGLVAMQADRQPGEDDEEVGHG
jgi:hypothetical protein